MPRARFPALRLEIEVPIGTSILRCSRLLGVPEASRCAGVCACSTCHVQIRSGAELLSPPEDDELDLLELSGEGVTPESRLGCQAKIIAEGTVDVELTEESFRAYLEDTRDETERERAMRVWMAREPR